MYVPNKCCVLILILLSCSLVHCFHGRSFVFDSRRVFSLFAKKSWAPPPSSPPSPPTGGGSSFAAPEPIKEIEPEEEQKGLAFVVDLPQYGSGISWSSDLSFRWVYVQDLDPAGEAFQSALIRKV
jgi:hypothetical protein